MPSTNFLEQKININQGPPRALTGLIRRAIISGRNLTGNDSLINTKKRDGISHLFFHLYKAGDGNRTHATSLEGWSS
ncbi:MAG: hypothetical protein LBF11_20190, partial [Paenibacillus polymyxa]|nr:hypothetical protein [Paenibacillus polymyxa]